MARIIVHPQPAANQESSRGAEKRRQDPASRQGTGCTLGDYSSEGKARFVNGYRLKILDSYLGRGIVDGSLLSAEVQGRRLADIAVRILKGESACFPIPHSKFDVGRSMFDVQSVDGSFTQAGPLAESVQSNRVRNFSF